tara:strand:+ start:1303 stop:1758 length:456 start_codon:yes stop_codon:yes gene_type:complete
METQTYNNISNKKIQLSEESLEKVNTTINHIQNDLYYTNYPKYYNTIVTMLKDTKERLRLRKDTLTMYSAMGNQLNIVGPDYAVKQEKERRPKMKIIADRFLELSNNEINYIIPLIEEDIKFHMDYASGKKKKKTKKNRKKKKNKKSKKII